MELAATLAQAMDATVHLVTAYGSSTVGMGPEVMVVPDHAEIVEAAKANLSALAGDLRQRGLTVEVHAVMGDPVNALCSVAEAVDADLIVTGNKRMQGPSRVLGSVPSKVAHRAQCHVLIAQTG